MTSTKKSSSNKLRGLLMLFCLLVPQLIFAQDKSISTTELKQLSVEELMNIRVSLASRTLQPITDAASAIQVISSDAIRRSGATNIPEALRLIPNLQVAQLNSHTWIISARGFNTLFANKLLVMIDGRTVYTPLFGGVIWDMQNVFIEDVDRIEVVSGPGTSLWGANAVNGIINIVTKNAGQSQGIYVSASAGDFLQDKFEARYGGRINNHTTFRIYGQHFDMAATRQQDEVKNNDNWKLTQAGFRVDIEPGGKNRFSITGDYYSGLTRTVPESSPYNGQNINATWSRTISDRSDFTLQVYYDRYMRNDKPGTLEDELNTVDIDFQHRLRFSQKHQILYGAGYRFASDHVSNKTAFVAILPEQKNIDILNAFFQDEFSVGKKTRIIAGTKLQHNVYTGWELQPSVRVAHNINNNQTLWAAVSHARRTPSRFDRDYFLPAAPQPPNIPSVAGGPNFESEKLVAFEAGYRIQPTSAARFAISAFYNKYSDVYSVDPLPGTLTYQIMNNSKARSMGIELEGTYAVTSEWRLRGGYTLFNRKITSTTDFDPEYLGNDAKHRIIVQSIVDLPHHLQFDIAARYLSKLDSTLATMEVPSYFTFDARLAWVRKIFEISVVGKNLAAEKHAEFNTMIIPRNVFVKLAVRI